MKQLLRISVNVLFAGLAILIFSQTAFCQKEDMSKLIGEKVASKNFTFIAQSASPLSGQIRILTSPYDVKLTKDSVVSYLPYFGNAQVPPTNNEDAGVMFTSTDFEYAANPGKKGSWEVVIKFKGQKNTSQFSFTIYDDGSTLLSVNSNFRDPISYRGIIKL